ncbi:hypothetical protein O6H91_Y000300 [Diphasiastrum complanatum]|nr:hypothetical protein O6H91_Y155100 [Diphasiastrum complanatum]KAJ7300298.1 hypothetical protein O6H91_Y000300 [Diphasiastrum complanatum]
MATIAATSCNTIAGARLLLHKSPAAAGKSLYTSAAPVTGLPALTTARIVCSAAKKTDDRKFVPNLAASITAAATLVASHPAVALVDDRLSGEGTGLSLGLSNPLLAWILLGVSALIWSLYFTYSSTLPKSDDESGLSL